MKNILLFLLAMMLFSACNKEPDIEEDIDIGECIGCNSVIAVIDDSRLLTGKWKLDTVIVSKRQHPPPRLLCMIIRRIMLFMNLSQGLD